MTDPYASERPISWRHVLDRPREAADARLAYGPGDNDYGELWLPDAARQGAGPYPLVVMIHGGCWQAEIPGTILQDQLAADLRARGLAVWNITYPRLGHEDGGYPGTYRSAAAAADHVRTLAQHYRVDAERMVMIGHSAGGHLALWLAARGRLPAGAPGAGPDPVLPRAVIGLAPIADLEAFAAQGPGRCGEPDTVDQIAGAGIGQAEGRADPFADTSPARLLPTGVKTVLVAADLDPIVPARLVADHAEAARAAGDAVTLRVIEAAGHFELIDPTAPAWAAILAEIEAALAEHAD